MHLYNISINIYDYVKKVEKMKKMIKADIYYDGEFYCGKCLDFDVFTQGKTLDELARNLKEALQLHFEMIK